MRLTPASTEPTRIDTGKESKNVMANGLMSNGSSDSAATSPWTTQRVALVLGLIVGAIVLRVMPHPWNLAPMGAIALFAGSVLPSRRLAYSVPLIAMILSDLIIGMHQMLPVVYLCFLFYVWLGESFLQKRKPLRIAGSALTGSLVFFVVTNFACWLAFYSHTWTEFVACYASAIPFYHMTLASDLFYSTVLFGGLAIVEQVYAAARPADNAI